jgi:aspartyl-tRNA(Asn)/glutamyl-tRNA(Gln) amidotransferase subunit B
MWETGRTASEIVEDKGLKQISDAGEIAAIVDQLIADNPEQAEQFRGGNEKVIGWFVGQVMKATQGKANPGLVNQVLRDRLG